MTHLGEILYARNKSFFETEKRGGSSFTVDNRTERAGQSYGS
jgi:hypothetical protein